MFVVKLKKVVSGKWIFPVEIFNFSYFFQISYHYLNIAELLTRDHWVINVYDDGCTHPVLIASLETQIAIVR